jgi:D-3-phosphoglycerate dehydrogenase
MASLNRQAITKRILIASPIDPVAIDRLRRAHDVVCAFSVDQEALRSLIGDREVLVFRSGVSVTSRIMDAARNLRLIIRAGCGLDNIDVEHAQRAGIQVVTIPEPGAQAVAEMAIALMLALARNLREADRLTRQGHWAKFELEGHLLSGKVLGIVGCGNIGSRVGELARAIGMNPLGCVEGPTAEVERQLQAKGIKLVAMDEVTARADFLSIHVPRTSKTLKLINASVFARLKPGCFLINLSRGGVVDEAALFDALTSRQGLRGAALDVHEEEGEGKVSPLATLPNVLLTPHIGAMTIDTQREIGQRVVEMIDEFAASHRASATQPSPRLAALLAQLAEPA